MRVLTERKIAALLTDIKPTIFRESHPISEFKFIEADPPGAQSPEYDDSAWRDFHLMDYWGGYDKIAWFRATVPIPAHLRDKKLSLRFLVGPRDGGNSTAETQLYVEGFPLQAIDVWHEEAWLPPQYSQQESIRIALRSWSSVLGVPDRRRFKVAQLNWIDEATEGYYFTALNLLAALRTLDENDWRRVQMLEALNDSILLIDFTHPRSDAYYASLAEAHDHLQASLERLHAIENREHKPKVLAVGHSHIDLAWLWRWRHSREKARRTFSTVLHLMDQYPDYRFIHSSPALYQALNQDTPETFERVKAKIASGQWEITGGMWVEADTNISGGEALIRQFLYGIRYVRETFGKEMKVLWLPDVFGYSAALPQLIRKSGMDSFMTTKISWSQFNRFPYDTFYWRGIDGTEVFTHFITAPDAGSYFYTYNGSFEPDQVKGLWDAYRDKRLNDELLFAFGWGDGGGGPTREMLESARVLKNLPGLPAVELGGVEPYFERLQERVAGKDLAVWDGELYLELHRGTYTSQAANKRANRKCEILYHDVETVASLADILLAEDGYPDLREGWELILFNQFHDILPGSSIRSVYEDSALDYQRVAEIGQAALNAAVQRITANVPADADSLVVMNTLSWARGGVVSVPWAENLDRRTVSGGLSQVVEEGGAKALLLDVADVPALGYATLPIGAADTTAEVLDVSPQRLENRYFRLELNAQGQLTSVWDKVREREVLAPGARGNLLQAFQDRPLESDAWDIDLFYQEKMQEVTDLVEAVVEETGPVRGTLRLVWRFYGSTITQRISLYRSIPRIDFRTEIDWHEQHILLKAAFPVNIRSRRASYDIQFGNLERPTHWNTSWDSARFEVALQKWMDLSEGNYGVALLNDCKYGGDVHDNVLRLTLLKSATSPDEQADQGHHTFTYSLFPHGNDRAAVVAQGYALNVPLHAALVSAQGEGALPPSQSLAQTASPNLIVETVKRAEDGDGWIVRVYESLQQRQTDTRLMFGRALRRAVECNLVEEGETPVQVENGDTLVFPITPFEIKTFRVWFAQ